MSEEFLKNESFLMLSGPLLANLFTFKIVLANIHVLF